jgi:membrane protein implicated in regulation of membrane protease activity
MQILASVIDTLGIWNWWVLAGILLVLELVTGTFFFLWLGTAALAVGVMMLFADWSWQVQLSVFAVLSVVLLAGSRLLIKRGDEESETFLNRRAARHVGRVFTLDRPIVDGRGRVKIDDTIWLVSGPDSPEKAKVKVTGVDGATLVVEPVDG